MNNSTELALLSNDSEIFQPIPHQKIFTLIWERNKKRGLINHVAAIARGEDFEGVISYFTTGTKAASIPNLFNEEKAQEALDADYWRKALALTDIYELMPQKRRSEWDDLLQNREMPAFTKENVIPTLTQLLSERPKFLAEKVDGIFQALSPDHVTNSPWAFSKKMIVAGVTDQYTFTSSRQCGHINDLRAVIARLMGREEPPYGSTRFVISTLRQNTGEWHEVDGGALTLKVYKVGTCHIKIHPEMAWRLNAILAHLHPRAIPAEHRTRPKQKKNKEVSLMKDLIPQQALQLLSDLRPVRGSHNYTAGYGWSSADKYVQKEAERVLSALGAISERHFIRFDYDAELVLNKVILSGSLPEEKSHQFYPTPQSLAERVISLANIQSGHKCLEPSAGQGNLVEVMPEDTDCIEISEIHRDILKSKNFRVVGEDFLDWNPTILYDRVVMNPPFSEGRWQQHVEKAFSVIKDNGMVCAILPESARGYEKEGWNIEFEEDPVKFPGVSIKVLVMKAKKVL